MMMMGLGLATSVEGKLKLGLPRLKIDIVLQSAHDLGVMEICSLTKHAFLLIIIRSFS